MLQLTCHYIDTCCPDYLLDHHNRNNEVLISAWANPGDDLDSIICELYDSLDYHPWLPDLNRFSDDEILNAIEEEFRDFSLPSYVTEEAQDQDKENSDSDYERYIYAYLAWEDDDD